MTRNRPTRFTVAQLSLVKSWGAALSFLLLIAISTSAPSAVLVPKPPKLKATSWIIYEAYTGTVIAELNADEPLPPASLTKMMTAYVASEKILDGSISYDEEVVVSKKAWKTGGSQMFIEVNKRVPVIDLLRGIIIQSANDASVAIAEHIAGTEDSFADLMNQYAEQMGLTNTHYVNASGFDEEGQYASARDMAILGARSVLDHPEDYKIYAEREFTYNDISQKNRNRLLWRDSDVDGIKTGYTKDAGYCLVGSAKKNNMRLVAVVMGTPSIRARLDETQALLTFGARFFHNHIVFSAEDDVHIKPLWFANQETLKVGLTEDLMLNMAKGNEKLLDVKIDLPETFEAPIQEGDALGTIEVVLEGEVVAKQPLVALESVEEIGFFGRIWHRIKRFFTGLF